MFDTYRTVLSSALAASGTLDINYLAGRGRGTYLNAPVNGHVMVANGNVYASPANFTVTLNAASFRITLGAGLSTIPAGSEIRVQLSRQGADNGSAPTDFTSSVLANKVAFGSVIRVDLGSPAAGAATTVCAAQAISGTNVAAVINGSLAAGGVATMDVPRSLQMVSTGAGDTTQTVTVTGRDEYGATMVETRTLNGTTIVQFQKAFAAVTGVRVSATMAGNLTLGTNNVLGLPFFLPETPLVIAQLSNGATATAGTLVAGAQALATASTGDVRGTYTPNATPDGSIAKTLLVVCCDPNYRGVPQFAG